MIERLCVLADSGTVQESDLPAKYRSDKNTRNQHSVDIPESGLDFNNTVNGFENELILKALSRTKWNRNQAAKLLNLNRTTLLEKIKKKGLRENIPPILDNITDPMLP